jgi:hypothetical protein
MKWEKERSHADHRCDIELARLGERSGAGNCKTNAEFRLNLQNFYDPQCQRWPGKEIDRRVQPVADLA